MIIDDICNALSKKRNIILYGPGGTGKSHTLKGLYMLLSQKNINVYMTATTGIAALNLSENSLSLRASTLHSWAGIGLGKSSANSLIKKIMDSPTYLNRWRGVDVLIIDEVSMFGKRLFEKLDIISKTVRENNRPFGGISLILSGDFMQLPPVKDEWIFKSDAWSDLNIRPFIFYEPKRYDDIDYFELLLRVRIGEQTPEDSSVLRSRVKSFTKLRKILQKNKDKTNILKPTILYSKRVDVEFHNIKELEKIDRQPKTFVALDTLSSQNDNHPSIENYEYLLNDIIPDTITLKEGAQVMLRFNFDVDSGLVNGSRGVVVSISDEGVFVRFVNGLKILITPHVWSLKDNNTVISRKQIPLILAWAITIHKSQGCTLDYAICDLGPSVFEFGQAYVSLSRVRNIKGLFISDYTNGSIKTSKIAKKYSLKLLEQSYLENDSENDDENIESDLEDEEYDSIRNLVLDD